jgi:hypothetical protein
MTIIFNLYEGQIAPKKFGRLLGNVAFPVYDDFKMATLKNSNLAGKMTTSSKLRF